jgi:hypothetical protein
MLFLVQRKQKLYVHTVLARFHQITPHPYEEVYLKLKLSSGAISAE